jgi:hypothetical protein
LDEDDDKVQFQLSFFWVGVNEPPTGKEAVLGYVGVLEVTLVLGFWGKEVRLGGMVHIASNKRKLRKYQVKPHSIIRIKLLLILSNIPYQGGGDYRGIYDIGFKRGF